MEYEATREQFERDGFVIAPNFLSKRELHELQLETVRTLREPKFQQALQKPSKFQGVLKNLNRVSPWFDHQLRQGSHTKLLRFLLDDKLIPVSAAYFDKIPERHRVIDPHVDSVGHYRNGATIWFALDRADIESGCMYYVRGTHRRNLSTADSWKDFNVNSPGATPVELDPGGAAIHSSRTVHWSATNVTQRSRRAISFFYWAASSKPQTAANKERSVAT